MNCCSIIFQASNIDATDKQELEIYLQNILLNQVVFDYIQMRQSLTAQYKLLKATAEWDNTAKIYKFIFAGDQVDKFIKKLKIKKEYIALKKELERNNIYFVSMKYFEDDYQNILPNWVNCKNLLPGHCDKGILDWHTSDSKKEFEKNLKTQPEDWIYRTKKVSYKLNRHGYRCPELETIDWSKSIVLFGCSMTSSVGLDEDDTLSKNLSKILEIPVISLGVAGSSPQYSFDNSIKLKENFPEPLCVVHLWSEYSRTVEYSNNIIHKGIGWPKVNTNISESHLAVNIVNYHTVSKFLWKNYLPYSFFTSTAMLLDIPELPTVDFSRDLTHYGYQTSKLTAEKISHDIKKIL